MGCADTPAELPNARYVDLADPAMATDFGVPVDGCESAWQQASSALVYDQRPARRGRCGLADALAAWARANPGRFTYPAPPDFTGSMVVRTFLYDTARDPSALAGAFDAAAFPPLAQPFWSRLNALEPALWRAGETYPTSQDAVEQLYATGEISAYFTYGPGTVSSKVADGVFPATDPHDRAGYGQHREHQLPWRSPLTRPTVAAALVFANLLQDPQTQLRFYADGGIYPVIDLDRLPLRCEPVRSRRPRPVGATARRAVRALDPRADTGYAAAVDDGWTANVLQR